MFAVMKNDVRATTHATRASAEAWIDMMAAAGMTGYTIEEVER